MFRDATEYNDFMQWKQNQQNQAAANQWSARQFDQSGSPVMGGFDQGGARVPGAQQTYGYSGGSPVAGRGGAAHAPVLTGEDHVDAVLGTIPGVQNLGRSYSRDIAAPRPQGFTIDGNSATIGTTEIPDLHAAMSDPSLGDIGDQSPEDFVRAKAATMAAQQFASRQGQNRWDTLNADPRLHNLSQPQRDAFGQYVFGESRDDEANDEWKAAGLANRYTEGGILAKRLAAEAASKAATLTGNRSMDAVLSTVPDAVGLAQGAKDAPDFTSFINHPTLQDKNLTQPQLNALYFLAMGHTMDDETSDYGKSLDIKDKELRNASAEARAAAMAAGKPMSSSDVMNQMRLQRDADAANSKLAEAQSTYDQLNSKVQKAGKPWAWGMFGGPNNSDVKDLTKAQATLTGKKQLFDSSTKRVDEFKSFLGNRTNGQDSASSPPTPQTKADFDALPSGTIYISKDGTKHLKP